MNDAPPPRTPPRFVPVLTEVVTPFGGASPAMQSWQGAQPPQPERPAQPQEDTQQPQQDALPQADTHRSQQTTHEPTASSREALEEQLIHRVMQRVDVSLERHLHDAVAAMVLQHTQALVPRLREEIEFVVRQAVAQAVADELAVQHAP